MASKHNTGALAAVLGRAYGADIGVHLGNLEAPIPPYGGFFGGPTQTMQLKALRAERDALSLEVARRDAEIHDLRTKLDRAKAHVSELVSSRRVSAEKDREIAALRFQLEFAGGLIDFGIE